MKKLITCVLILLSLFALTSCGGNKTRPSTEETLRGLLNDFAAAKCVVIDGTSLENGLKKSEFKGAFKDRPDYRMDATVNGERYFYFTSTLLKFNGQDAEVLDASAAYEKQKSFIPYTLLAFTLDFGNISSVTENGADTIVLTFAGNGVQRSFNGEVETRGGNLVIGHKNGRIAYSSLSFGTFSNLVRYSYEDKNLSEVPFVTPRGTKAYYSYLLKTLENKYGFVNFQTKNTAGALVDTGARLSEIRLADAKITEVQDPTLIPNTEYGFVLRVTYDRALMFASSTSLMPNTIDEIIFDFDAESYNVVWVKFNGKDFFLVTNDD